MLIRVYRRSNWLSSKKKEPAAGVGHLLVPQWLSKRFRFCPAATIRPSIFTYIEEPEFYTKWLDQRYGVREIVAQHVGWLGQFAGELHRSAMQNGWDQQGWVQWDDMETWDETFSEHARGKDKSQIMHELEQAVSSFKEAVEPIDVQSATGTSFFKRDPSRMP